MIADPDAESPELGTLPPSLAERGDYLVHRLDEVLRRELSMALRGLRLSLEHYMILQIVAAYRGCSRDTIGALSELDPNVVAVAVRSLTRRGALVVARPESDRRKRVYALTRVGADVLEAAEREASHARRRTFAVLESAEREAFLDSLRKLVYGD